MVTSIKLRVKNLLRQMPRKANYKFLLKDWKPLFELKYAAQVLETKRFYQNMDPVLLDRPEGERFLVLAPHCDDDTFGLGGTLLKLQDEGAEIHVLYFFTTGRSGEDKRKIRAEAEEICSLQGIIPHFLEQSGRGYVADDLSAGKIRSLIDDVNPDAVFTTFLLDDHVDHREINNVLRLALEPGRDRFEIWSYQVYSTVLPNVVIDITGKMDRKMELMEMWKSVQGNRNWPHYVMGINASNCRYIPGRKKLYAETFFVLPAAEYRELAARYFEAVHAGR